MDQRINPNHRRSTSDRWLRGRNRTQEASDYKDEWRTQQCGQCQYWIPLAGTWGLDYGAYSNEASTFDGSIRFEHDGCEAFLPAEQWGSPQEIR